MTNSGLTVTVWKYRRWARILSSMDEAPAEGNLRGEQKDILTVTVESYKVLKQPQVFNYL